jgi:hypothetical protein
MDEQLPENSEAIVADTGAEISENPAPEPKKRGRPKGSPDKAPRKKKTVIIVEPVSPEIEEAAPAPTPPEPTPKARPAKRAPEIEEGLASVEQVREQHSPRSLYREAARHVLYSRGQQLDERRNTLRQMFASKLVAWPG